MSNLSEKRKQQMREYSERNREKVLEAVKKWFYKKYKTDELFRNEKKIRNTILLAFKRGGWKERSRLNEIVGCSYLEYRAHIESTWTEGMSWENKGIGKGKWSVDHIFPPSKATTQEEMEARFHYTNTQALWSVINSSKGNK